MKSKFLVFATILGVFFSVTPTTAQIIKSSQTITTKTQIKKEKVKKERKILPPVTPGYEQSIEATLGISDFDYSDTYENQFGIEYIGGYRFNNYFYAGIGIGLCFNTAYEDTPCLSGPYQGPYEVGSRVYEDYFEMEGIYENFFKVPLYLYARIYMTKTRCQPFFALSIGGQISGRRTIENETDFEDLEDWSYSSSSFFINPQLGVSYRITEKYSLYLTAGLMARTIPAVYDKKQDFSNYYGCRADSPYDFEVRHPMLPHLDFNLGFTF